MFIHGLSLAELALNERSRKKLEGRVRGARNFRSLRCESKGVHRGLKDLSSVETRLDGEVRYSENPVTAITGLEDWRRESRRELVEKLKRKTREGWLVFPFESRYTEERSDTRSSIP